MLTIPPLEQGPEKEGLKTFIENLEKLLQQDLNTNLVNKTTCVISSPNLPLKIFFYLPSAFRIDTGREDDKMAIHIDLDMWLTKPEVLLNRVLTLCGKGKRMYGRETILTRIDKKRAMDFQENHHLQVALPGKYRYGLFKDEELLSVAVFSGLRKMRHTPNYRSIELLRFCHKGRNLVVGGLSKILSAMVRDFSPNDIMTYIDKDWSSGEKFEKLGFVALENTAPQQFIVERSDFKRHSFRKGAEYTLFTDGEYIVTNLGSIKMVKIV